MNIIEIVSCLDKKSDQIISLAKTKGENKIYFQNLNLPAVEIIEIAAKSYIENIKISLETESYRTFEDEVKWFKSMGSKRLQDIDIRTSLLDLHQILTMEIYCACCQNNELNKVLKSFKDIIENTFAEELKDEH